MCHALAAITTHLPVLGNGMLGDLVDLYRVATSHSSTDKQQELLVRDDLSESPYIELHTTRSVEISRSMIHVIALLFFFPKSGSGVRKIFYFSKL